MFSVQPTALSGYIRQLDEQQHHTDQPIPETSFVWGIVAQRGAGKSTLILSLLDSKWGKGRFHNIFWCSQTWRSDSYSKAPLKELIEELEEDGKVYDDFTDSIAEDIIQRITDFNAEFRKANEDAKAAGKKPPNKGEPRSLLIIDDCLSSLPRNRMDAPSSRLVVNGRHMKISVILTSQKFNAIPVLWRQNMSILSMFPSANKKDLDALLNDLNIDEAMFKRLTEYVWDNPRSFLHINMLTTPMTFYKKFDKIKQG